jgi:CheY-like chemotaxis protein
MEKKLILVVENDEDLRHLLVDALNHTDRQVVEAGNAYEAFERINRRLPVLIVTDLQMPGGGLEYLAQLRHRVPSSAIVAITAGRGELGRTEVLAHGATAYLEKPVRMKQVRSTVDALLNPPRP